MTLILEWRRAITAICGKIYKTPRLRHQKGMKYSKKYSILTDWYSYKIISDESIGEYSILIDILIKISLSKASKESWLASYRCLFVLLYFSTFQAFQKEMRRRMTVLIFCTSSKNYLFTFCPLSFDLKEITIFLYV